MKAKWMMVVMLFMLVPAGLVLAQDTENVHLFQNFFHDATVAKTPYGAAGLGYSSYDAFSEIDGEVVAGYPVNEKVEVGVGLRYMNWSPEDGDGQGGLADPYITGRYLIKPGPTQIAAGGYATLPIGSEDVGQGHLNFGAYGAVRHQLEKMTITGTVGLNFYEIEKLGDFDFETGEFKKETDRENYLSIGAGVIYPVNDALHVIGELNMKTDIDYMLLSGGVDYNMGNVSYRGALGIGLDDGAPDLQIMASYLLHF